MTRNPDHVHGHFLLAMVYADAGRDQDAREELARCRALNPTYSPEGMRGIVPYKDQDLVDHWMANVRRLRASSLTATPTAFRLTKDSHPE